MSDENDQIPPRRERLAEFYRRMQAAPPAASEDEAYALLCDTMNAVEDELTGIPYDPDRWQQDGRLYPPQADRSDRGILPGAIRYRTRGHDVFIGDNGAILFMSRKRSQIELSKPGADGREVKL